MRFSLGSLSRYHSSFHHLTPFILKFSNKISAMLMQRDAMRTRAASASAKGHFSGVGVPLQLRSFGGDDELDAWHRCRKAVKVICAEFAAVDVQRLKRLAVGQQIQ
jgi:hypothetical protein